MRFKIIIFRLKSCRNVSHNSKSPVIRDEHFYNALLQFMGNYFLAEVNKTQLQKKEYEARWLPWKIIPFIGVGFMLVKTKCLI